MRTHRRRHKIKYKRFIPALLITAIAVAFEIIGIITVFRWIFIPTSVPAATSDTNSVTAINEDEAPNVDSSNINLNNTLDSDEPQTNSSNTNSGTDDDNNSTDNHVEDKTKVDKSEDIMYNTFIYGQSESKRDLICHLIGPKDYKKTILLNFTIHGFEDNYSRDGQVLVDAANALIEHYKNNDLLKDTRLLIIPLANPDGLLDGYTNNGFGRNNANGVDLNRDFDANHLVRPEGRNYTPSPFSASESRALRDLVLEYKPDVVLDLHGWLNTTIGNGKLAKVFRDELGLPHQQEFGSGCRGYFTYWTHLQGISSLLVEFKDPKINTEKLIKTINKIINNDY